MGGRGVGPRPGAGRVAPAAGRCRVGRCHRGRPAWFGRDLPAWADDVVHEELRRAGAVGLPVGGGVALAAPTILTHGPDAVRERFLDSDPDGRDHVVPAVQRTRRRVRSGRADDDGRARRRPLDRQRAEGVEHLGPPRRLRHPRGPHRLGRPQASWAQLLRAPDEATRRRGAAIAPDELPRLVQRGVHDRRRDPDRPSHRRGGRRLGGGPDDAGLRTSLRRDDEPAPLHRWRTSHRRGGSRSRRAPADVLVVSAAGRPRRSRGAARLSGRRHRRPAGPPGRRGRDRSSAGQRLDGRAGQGGPSARSAAWCGGLDRQAGVEQRWPGRRARCTPRSAAPTPCWRATTRPLRSTGCWPRS